MTSKAHFIDLPDHFSATVHLSISEPQPQYGIVQLNAMRDASNEIISCDVSKQDFLDAVAEVCGVVILTADDYRDVVSLLARVRNQLVELENSI